MVVLRKVIRRARHAALAGICGLGGFEWLASSAWRRKRLLILCYHGVSLRDEHKWNPELFVSSDFLRRRFEFLRENKYVILPLGEAVHLLQRGGLAPRSVVLTFDDGFYNFFAAAAPLLEEFSYPATVYLSTYYCVHQRPILELCLRYLLWRSRQKALIFGALAGEEDRIDLRDSEQRERLGTKLHEKAKTFSDDHVAQMEWLAQVATHLGLDWESFIQKRLFHLMTETEVADIARRGIDVQLHTHRHQTPHENGSFYKEILENRRIIEELTGRPAVHFCYPSGEVNSLFQPWLRDLGVETATTCSIGLSKKDHDLLLLPRYVDTMLQSEVVFEGWMCGAGNILSGRLI